MQSKNFGVARIKNTLKKLIGSVFEASKTAVRTLIHSITQLQRLCIWTAKNDFYIVNKRHFVMREIEIFQNEDVKRKKMRVENGFENAANATQEESFTLVFFLSSRSNCEHFSLSESKKHSRISLHFCY